MMSWWSYWSRLETLAVAIVVAAVAGCGHGGSATDAQESTAARVIPVTVASLEHRSVERTVEVIGSLRGWEQVTVGTKRTGRVVKVHHDIGDRVQPGEPLVELDPVDAKLGVQQAESRYLGELVKLGITRRQAEEIVAKYGISEELLIGQVADDAIAKVPSVIQKRVARERAQQHLTRQRATHAARRRHAPGARRRRHRLADSRRQLRRRGPGGTYGHRQRNCIQGQSQPGRPDALGYDDPGSHAQAHPPELEADQRPFLWRHQAAGVRGSDDQGRRGDRRTCDRRPDPPLEPGTRTICRGR